MKASLWRIELEGQPVLTVCSTEKWKNGLQPYMDEDENIVTLGQSHFETRDEAVQFVVLNKQRDIETLRMTQALKRDEIAGLDKAIEEAEVRLKDFQKKAKKADD
jgi:hypothetical protein